MAITFTKGDTKQNYLKGSPSNIDVIKDCAWAIFDGNSIAAREVPYITMTEYQPIGDQFLTKARSFIDELGKSSNLSDVIAAGSNIDAYKDTYRADRTENVYTFPYFTPEMRSKTISWGTDTTISIPPNISNALNKAASVGVPVINQATTMAGGEGPGISPGLFGIEFPKIWNGTDVGATYTFDFFLHNTVSEEHTASNYNLTYLLSYNNSYNRRNLIIQDAPVLYSVHIPGIRYSPAAAMKELKINMIGQMRSIRDLGFGVPSPVIIPESYHIIITMEDLFVESRQILNLALNGNIDNAVTVFAAK